jgi:hypothetical protein
MFRRLRYFTKDYLKEYAEDVKNEHERVRPLELPHDEEVYDKFLELKNEIFSNFCPIRKFNLIK